MTQLENITAIEKRLWGAADTLRANSNYASNEYQELEPSDSGVKYHLAKLKATGIICHRAATRSGYCEIIK